jgi:hypothetical protein
MKTIYGYLLLRDCKGAAVPVVGRKMYAQPEKPQALFMDGTAWAPSYRNAAITQPGYERAIECMTDGSGKFSFGLPQASETFVPGGGSTDWIITDPSTPISFKGPVLDGLAPSIDVRDLVVSNGWQVIPSVQVFPSQTVNLRTGFLTFTASTGVDQDAQIEPPFSSAEYIPVVGGATDDIGEDSYNGYVLMQSRTPSQFTIRISDDVPALRSVKIPWFIQG